VVDGTRLLFGLPGMRVERVERLPDGTGWCMWSPTNRPRRRVRRVELCPSRVTAAQSPLTATSLTVKTELSCGGTRVAGDAGKTTANAARSPRPSSRCRRGRGPHGCCAPRSLGVRRGRSVGGRGRRGPRRVVADRAPRVRRARRDASGRAANHPGARHRRDPPGKPRWQRCAKPGQWVPTGDGCSTSGVAGCGSDACRRMSVPVSVIHRFPGR
jgi:hypothetical protein